MLHSVRTSQSHDRSQDFLMSKSSCFKLLNRFKQNNHLPQTIVPFIYIRFHSNHILKNYRIANMTSAHSSDVIEKCKENAARLVVDENIKTDCIVGIGSGSTMTYVLNRIVQQSKEKGFSVECIPTSFQSKQLIHDYNLQMTEIDRHPVIDIAIDGADEVDENLVAIKGGGACLAQEKVVAFSARRFLVVADYRKDSKNLGENWKKGIPIEVLPMACGLVRYHVSNLFDVPAEDLVLRIGREKAGPVITDNGNMILDWMYKFSDMKTTSVADWRSLADRIKLIPGVVETGIFAGMIKEAYFGQPDGTVVKRLSK